MTTCTGFMIGYSMAFALIILGLVVRNYRLSKTINRLAMKNERLRNYCDNVERQASVGGLKVVK